MDLSRARRLGFFVSIFFFACSSSHPARAGSLQCQHLPQLFDAYLKNHYAFHKTDDAIRAHTVEQFIKSMDPSKTLLLDDDVAHLRKDLGNVFITMNLGNCGALDDANKVMISRAEEDEAYVKTFMGKDYKLDDTVELQLDPDKRTFAKSQEERRELLKKMVHFQISSYLLTDMKLGEAKKQLVHRYELITKRVKTRKASAMVESFAEAFAMALDPHSSYMSQDTMEDFQIQMRLSLEGIGASLTSHDGFTVIEDLIPGGGAEKCKLLEPKDKIIAVAQEGKKAVSVIDMDLPDVVKQIRGKKGTKVTLTILRQAEKTSTFDVTIARDKIDIKDQAAKITYESRNQGGHAQKIGIIDLPSFYGGGEKDGGRSSYYDVKRLLEEAKQQKVDGIVLDLARNGGGLLDDAVRISGLFIRKGGVVATKDSEAHVQVLADEDEDVAYAGPLVVLTSRLSASASEILAGALHDYHRAIVVGGDHTFGKGTVQILSALPFNLGAMKVTTGMFFIPGGDSTQHKGVSADIRLPSVFSNDELGEKSLDYSLPPQSIASFKSKEANTSDGPKHWRPVDESLIRKLAEKSQQRVSKDPKFAEIRKSIEDAAKNKGVVRLAEIRKKAEAESKADKAEKEKNDKSKKKGAVADAPLVEESVNIVADWLALAPSYATLTE